MKYLTAILVWILLALAPCAQAIPVLSLASQGPGVQPGGRLYVDLMISGLEADEVLGAFSLNLAFSPALQLFPFAAGGSRFGPYLGSAALGQALGDADIAPGSAFIYEFSLLSSAELAGLQDSSFRLATLQFFLPADSAIPASRLLDIAVDSFILSDADGNFLPGEAGPAITVKVPEPQALALLVLGLVMMAWVRTRTRRWHLGAAAMCLSGAALAQTVAPPLPSGPLNLTITSTSDVLEPYYITQGTVSPYNASLIPFAVNESVTTRYAQFTIVSPQVVTITFSSDDGANFDRNFEFTPGIYFVGMQYFSPLGTDYAELWIQKASGGIFGPRLVNIRKDADTYVHAFFRSGPNRASGILQTSQVQKSASVTRQVNVPGGSASFTNASGLWPYPLICQSPARCNAMLRTVAVDGDGSVDLYSQNGANAVTRTLAPTRYDQLDLTSSGFDLHVVHSRVAFIPPGPPTIAALPEQAPMVPQDAPRSVTLRGIGDGTPDETQAISITASSSNPAIIAAPVIAYQPGDDRAILTYRPGGGHRRGADYRHRARRWRHAWLPGG